MARRKVTRTTPKTTQQATAEVAIEQESEKDEAVQGDETTPEGDETTPEGSESDEDAQDAPEDQNDDSGVQKAPDESQEVSGIVPANLRGNSGPWTADQYGNPDTEYTPKSYGVKAEYLSFEYDDGPGKDKITVKTPVYQVIHYANSKRTGTVLVFGRGAVVPKSVLENVKQDDES